jgi:hypothetical protein
MSGITIYANADLSCIISMEEAVVIELTATTIADVDSKS